MTDKKKQTTHRHATMGPGLFIAVMLTLVGINTAANTSTHADIMIVLDLSGSMKTTDSDSRFDSFFTWATAFASADDRIGIVAMGNRAKLVAPLTTKNNFDFSDIRHKLNHRSQHTDVAAGLENAYYELKNNSRKDTTRLVLLFSDAQIDMPKGMWDLENSLRYLHNSLIPAMKRENIRLIAVVPDGLRANFQLLHELANGTGGSYYRGIPGDAVAIRQQLAFSAKPLKAKADNRSVRKSKQPAKSRKADASQFATASSKSSSANGSNPVDPESAEDPSETAESGTQDGIEPGFYILGGVLLLGFGVVFTAIVLLFRRTSQTVSSDSSPQKDALVNVLAELQSLKSETEESDLMAKQYDVDLDENETPNFGEPSDELSVSLVSPFLDYEETEGTIKVSPTDEIAIKPAFSEDHSDDSSLSVSNMETLIGTGMPEIEEK